MIYLNFIVNNIRDTTIQYNVNNEIIYLTTHLRIRNTDHHDKLPWRFANNLNKNVESERIDLMAPFYVKLDQVITDVLMIDYLNIVTF